MQHSAYITRRMQERSTDIAILGGGLAGGLLALALARLRPEQSVTVVERGATLGGNHVWSFFATDVADQDHWLVEPLIEASWDGYEVRFPRLQRNLATRYCSTTSERLDAALRSALPAERLLTGTEVVHATHGSVELADGRTLSAGAVIDARGSGPFRCLSGGWQKFVGRLLRLDAPHGLARPIVMDARVEQHDGYRFVYCLPFGSHEIFVEDTYYSDSPALDPALLGRRIEAYCRDAGWTVSEVLREEHGVLPVIAGGDFERFWPDDGEAPARAGAAAALVHPLTSYSLPDAVRFARFVADIPDLSGPALARASRRHAQEHWRQMTFYRTLSRMLFAAARPERRFEVLQHFYRRPQALIERFYAGRTTALDRLRILSGRPPVPLGRAMACLAGMGRPLASLEAA